MATTNAGTGSAKGAKPDGGDKPTIIKKYANRRLYNTSKSSYITLDHLARMVRAGENFTVKDAKSGEDITRSVLTQIIFEEEAKGTSMLPTNFLRQIISLYGDSLQSIVPGYLEASMDTFSRNQEQMRENVTRMFGANPAMENMEAVTRRNMELFSNAMRMFSPFPQSDSDAGETSGGGADDTGRARSEELDALKSQLAAMQTQLDKISKK